MIEAIVGAIVKMGKYVKIDASVEVHVTAS